MISEIPVIFIHYGNSPYFHTTVQQAAAWGNQVIVLGDGTNTGVLAEHYMYADYSMGVPELESHYIHRHNREKKSEFFSIARWFMLYRFCKKFDIPCVYYVDSDEMLYRNVNELYSLLLQDKYWAAIDVPANRNVLRQVVIGHGMWTLGALENFVSFIQDVYERQRFADKIKYKWDWHQRTGTGGGICDMTLLSLWYNQHAEKTGINTVVLTDNSTCDHAISTAENHQRNEYQAEQVRSWHIKKVSWNNNRPYCFNLKKKTPVQFNTLHFQGGRKILIDKYRRSP